MKWLVQSGIKMGQSAFRRMIEMPVEFDIAIPANPGKLQVHVSRDGGQSFNPVLLTRIGDGQSWLIGNKIYRISERAEVFEVSSSSQNLSATNLRIRCGGRATPTMFEIEPVKPIRTVTKGTVRGGGDLKSPLAGKVLKLCVQPNAQVVVGQALVVIEAMKMENQILAQCAGTVTAIQVCEGQLVLANEILLHLKAALENGSR